MDANDKLAFSERLKLALRRSTKPVETPSELALQFNLRHKNDPITQQAAQKWLTGKAKPTADKVETLAAWLEVSAHWLNYGTPEARSVKPTVGNGNKTAAESVSGIKGITEEERALLLHFRQLPARRKQLLLEIATEFALEQTVWPDTAGGDEH